MLQLPTPLCQRGEYDPTRGKVQKVHGYPENQSAQKGLKDVSERLSEKTPIKDIHRLVTPVGDHNIAHPGG